MTRLRPWLLGLAFAVGALPLIRLHWNTANVWSRYMAIESLAERGTLVANQSSLLGQSFPDVASDGRHFYTDKPPVLPALGAVVYRAFGLNMQDPLAPSDPSSPARAIRPAFIAAFGGILCSRPGFPFPLTTAPAPILARIASFEPWVADLDHANFVLTACLVVLPSALAVVGLRLLLKRAPIPSWGADLLAPAFGFTSLLLPYAVTFNNHAPAAGLITLAFGLVADEPAAGRLRGRRFLVGLLLGLAATIDLPAGAGTAGVIGAWLLLRQRGLPLAFLLGMIGPLALHSALQAEVTGSPFPVEMYPKMFEYPGSYWATEEGRWKEIGPRWRFGVEFLIGPQGWLTVTPALFLGLAGLAWTASRKGDPLRPLACAAGTVTILLIVYYVWGVRRTDFSGQSYGTRHLLAISPVLFAFAVDAAARMPRRIGWIVLALTLIVGLGYAIEGVRQPWSRIDRRDDAILKLLGRLTLYPHSSYPR